MLSFDLPPTIAMPTAPSMLLTGLVGFYVALACGVITVWMVRHNRIARQRKAVQRSMRLKQQAAEDHFRRQTADEIATLRRSLHSAIAQFDCYQQSNEHLSGEASRLSAELLQINLRLANLDAGVEGLQQKFVVGAEDVLPTLAPPQPGMVRDKRRGWIFESQPESVDDLTQIWGIGPGYQRQLQKHGIYRLQQIAMWDTDTISHFDAVFSFKGRIDRENWVAQAKRLCEPDTIPIAA